MPERKVWSQEEDRILRYLKEEKGERKWATIARLMERDFGVGGRTGKQCRQRYHNHLDASIVTTEWTQEEEEVLYLMHEELGNKWALIAQKMPGRSDNCVKNHFYSKLRKTLRRLNKLILEYLPREHEPIRSSAISRLIEASESKFKSSSRVDEELADFCNTIIHRLFLFAQSAQEEVGEELLEEGRELIQDIQNFEVSFKKGYKVSGSRTDLKEEPNYLKPPSFKMRRHDSNGSVSSDRSEDSSVSFLSSSSCSFISDQSEEPQAISKSTRSRSGIHSEASEVVDEEVEGEQKESGRGSLSCGDKAEKREEGRESPVSEGMEQESAMVHFDLSARDHEVMEAEKFMQMHGEMLESEHSGEVRSPSNSENFDRLHYQNIFYEESPLQLRVLTPASMEEEQQQQRLFGSDDEGEIEYQEEQG